MNYTPEDLQKLPETPGVYIYRNSNREIIYIGKAINIKKRVKSYFRKDSYEKSQKIASLVTEIGIITVESEFEALLLEARLIRESKPKYNVIWRDDKSYIYIEITKDEFPRILLSRKRGRTGNLYGPYPSAGWAREIIRFLRHVFPFCTQKLPAKKVCFYNHLDLCNPCTYEIVNSPENIRKKLKSEYMGNINSIKKILKGNFRKVTVSLTKDMLTASKNNDFEKAAELRDKAEQLKLLFTKKSLTLTDYIENPDIIKEKYQNESFDLKKLLSAYFDFPKDINFIECYDISNISGKLATGSMVTFKKSYPDKTRYRHFRIRTIDTPNDFQMLNEVFQRRLKHKEWPLPELIMVDGGQGQLEVLLSALKSNGVSLPAVSLAKKLEEIYLSKGSKFIKLRLPENSPALNLLKRLRDESHRFANSYHRKLRIKNLLGELKN